MRYVPFIVHICNMLGGGVPLIDTSASVVHAVIECVFKVSKEKKILLEQRLHIYIKCCKSNCWVFIYINQQVFYIYIYTRNYIYLSIYIFIDIKEPVTEPDY